MYLKTTILTEFGIPAKTNVTRDLWTDICFADTGISAQSTPRTPLWASLKEGDAHDSNEQGGYFGLGFQTQPKMLGF